MRGVAIFAKACFGHPCPSKQQKLNATANAFGMLFASIMLLSAWLLWRKQLFESRWMLWVLMLSAPLPYFATIAGWMTTEIGRQPWLVYGLMRTVEGASPHVSSGNVLFTFAASHGERMRGLVVRDSRRAVVLSESER
jgi:hypothetical protein